MKDFDPILKLNPDTQLIAEAQKEYTLKGRMVKQRGLILFAILPKEDFKAERVKITSEVVYNVKTGKAEKKHKAHYKQDAIYIWAINEATAIKKAKKLILNFILNERKKK